MNSLRNFVKEMENADSEVHAIRYKYNIKGHVFINIADSLFKKAKNNNNYLISKLSFVKYKDGMIIDDLNCWVDEYKLFEPTIDGKTPLNDNKIREFFELSYAHNGGQLNKQLVDVLEKQIPLCFHLPTTQQIPLILKHMSSTNGSDVKDPNKIYLNHIRLLSENKKRSEFMS